MQFDEKVAKKVGLVPRGGFKFSGTLDQFKKALALQGDVDELFEQEVNKDLALREESNEEN